MPAGPYANFRWPTLPIFQEVTSLISKQKDRYGYDTIGKSKRVVLEYCSPNIAKPSPQSSLPKATPHSSKPHATK